MRLAALLKQWFVVNPVRNPVWSALESVSVDVSFRFHTNSLTGQAHNREWYLHFVER